MVVGEAESFILLRCHHEGLPACPSEQAIQGEGTGMTEPLPGPRPPPVSDMRSCFDPNNPSLSLVLLLLPVQIHKLSLGRKGDLPGARRLVSMLVTVATPSAFQIAKISRYSVIAE